MCGMDREIAGDLRRVKGLEARDKELGVRRQKTEDRSVSKRRGN